MTRSLACLIRLALAVALGLLVGKAFGNRYLQPEEAFALGSHVWEPSLAVQRAAQIAGAVVGGLLGVLALTPWMRNTTRGLALLRGLVAAVLLALIASRATGLFSEKFLPAVAAFAVLGALLTTIRGRTPGTSPGSVRRSRVETLRPALARGAKGALLGLGVALVPSLLMLATGPGLAFGLCIALPPLGALLGFGIGVLLPANA